MNFARRTRTIPAWLVALPLVLSACKGCKKDPKDDQGDVVVQDVTSRVAVTAIDPARVAAQQAFSATVRGAGFESGSRVEIGGVDVSRVTFLNSNQLAIDVGPMAIGRYDVEVTNVDGSSAILRGGLTVDDGGAFVACDAATVYFDTDKSNLNGAATGTLDSRVACYTKTSGTVRVEGHCDERGTTDYNLALGQRRADAVRKHLIGKGVSGDRVSTISFGEERPADPASNEAAWQKNRRAEVTVTR